MNCLDDTSRIGFLRFGHPDELPPDGARESSSVAMRRKKSRPVENGEVMEVTACREPFYTH
jgi:hypothetical protein